MSVVSLQWSVVRLQASVRVLLFFFFSSRRRHTISDRDWSSDVCSSDLGAAVRDRARDRPQGYDAGGDRRDGGRGGGCRGTVRPGLSVLAVRLARRRAQDRKRGVEGKSVDLGGRRIIKKKKERR